MKEEMSANIPSPLMNSYETTPQSSSFQTPSSSYLGSPNDTKNHPRINNGFAYRILEHVKLGANISETVKGKLILGARIIQKGGRKNVFKQIFGVEQGEKLLKASQCYLSTTAGPIAGLLFISTHKLAFCSETSINFPSSSPNGDFVKSPYKVSIPIRKVKRANQRENMNEPAQKYIEIVTEDGFDFWFMGFLRYEKAFTNLHQAISMAAS